MPVPSGTNPPSNFGAELVTVPYVTTATFAAYPSYAELDNLVTGIISQSANLAELNNELIRASQWATDQANVPLHAHIKVENKVLRCQPNGSISFHPAHNPVKLVTALQYAWDLTAVPVTVADLTGQWIEESAQVNLAFPAMSTSLNNIQFGPPAGTSSPLYTTWTYQAGYVNTTLAASSLANATSVTVTDPTGIVPGDRLRVWEPGVEEACTVGAAYVTGSTTVPLVSGLTNAHVAGAGLSAIPGSIQLAVIYYTCALLMRPDSRTEDQFPDARTGITTRSEDARRDGSGLISEAYRQIRSYMRVR